jgi:hypothetical protein
MKIVGLNAERERADKIRRLAATYSVGGKQALNDMSAAEVRLLLSDKTLDLNLRSRMLRDRPHNEVGLAIKSQLERQVTELANHVKERDVNDISEYLKETQRAPKVSVLDQLRQEIEKDTKSAQSEPERLARTRAQKEQGPIEVPKQKGNDRGMER